MVQAKMRNVTLFVLLTIASATIWSSSVSAEVLFEGYSKVTSGGVHIGYTISRYEFDPKTKHFKGTYFLKTGALGSDLTESVKSEADQDLNPISYEYTSLVGKKAKTIDAKIVKGKLTAIVDDGGVKKTIRKDIDKGVFLSNFLVYVILKSKTGMQINSRYSYSAIAEEDAEVSKGDALVEKEEPLLGVHTYRVLNRFKEIKFTSSVTDRGEVIATSSPGNGVATQLMARPNDATGKFGLSATILKNLFGDVPLGTANILSRANKEEALPSGTIPGKQGGVAPGSGIQIKSESIKAGPAAEPIAEKPKGPGK